MATRIQVVFDCADPARLADFWAKALGYIQPDPPEGFTTWEEWLKARGIPEEQWNSANAVEDPEGVGPRIFFQRVPEPKTVKNRVHLDVNVADRGIGHDERKKQVDAAVERLKAEGASALYVNDREPGNPDYYGVVMQDPEGNEFCVQ
jgi:catechol 2,3-dioxygenase-like lactoylglutathione lyase family enzyme